MDHDEQGAQLGGDVHKALEFLVVVNLLGQMLLQFLGVRTVDNINPTSCSSSTRSISDCLLG